MSRLMRRYGVRTLSVALLSVGVAGGFYLGEDRKTQQLDVSSQQALDVENAEFRYQHEQYVAHADDVARQRAAQQEAARKAAEAARLDAERAKAAAAASRAKEREKKAAAEAKAAAAKSAGTTTTYTGPIPSSCNSYSGNRKTGCALMLDAGFKIDQMPCLDKLWTKESHWNPKATNPSSGAYGIAQAVPGSKMASVADDWKTNPATQIKWGLGYIEGRYDTPCGAWSHSQSTGWY
ncbi:transglycosylase SLT domain-containing protein [Plantactinospora siamensis]|uniref:Transglycosylase SLT domain-containing protein n=1 Tax=Plantactinospora siamensis TaxID=555372 RepID=A0ABV6NYJ5_9ACTN